MTQRLQNVITKEISIVPKGMNRKKIYLRKSADTEDSTMEELEKAQKEAADAKTALEKAAADSAALATKVGVLEKAAADAATASEAAAASAAAEKTLLEKAAADSAAKTIELEKALSIEKEAKEVAESIKKASESFKNLPEKAEDLGPLLRRIRKADAEAADKVEALLAKVDAISKGALDSRGTAKAGDATVSALDEIEKRAKTLVVEKKAKNLADGMDKVLVADKALYAQYQAEKNTRV